MTPAANSLAAQFGDIDIYVFDQLLRGRITPEMTVLDAGCGAGRNIAYLLRSGCEVLAVDQDQGAIDAVRRLAGELAPRLARENFRVEPIEAMTFPDGTADVVISSAVLHFARDEAQFWAMLQEMWRVLRPGGVFFARLASTIGMEGRFRQIAGRRYHVPDGTERFLVDEPMLVDATARLGGKLLDPLKTSVVQNLRCMTTWVVRKTPAAEAGADAPAGAAAIDETVSGEARPIRAQDYCISYLSFASSASCCFTNVKLPG